MSPDLRLATVYVMPLGGKDVEPVLAALERHKKYIRGEIAHAINLKFAPDVRFLADETFDEADRIERLLAQRQGRGKDSDKIEHGTPQEGQGRSTAGWCWTSRSA